MGQPRRLRDQGEGTNADSLARDSLQIGDWGIPLDDRPGALDRDGRVDDRDLEDSFIAQEGQH